MALGDPVFAQVGLIEIALPGATIRLCDGGFIDWPARGVFTAEDSVFGTIESVGEVSEGLSDEAPSVQLTLAPPEISAASDLFLPDAQGSEAFFWLGEIDPATGALIGDPELEASCFIDTLTLRLSKERRVVETDLISQADRFFWTAESNVLSERFHKSVWPGETGFDHATGVQLAVPWGVAGQSRGSTTIGSTAGGFFGGGTNFMLRQGQFHA